MRRALALSLLCACSARPPTIDLDSGRPDAGRFDAGPRPDAGRDAGPDAGPCGALAACGDLCVDVASDPMHCGSCEEECVAPANAIAICAASACGFACVAGFVEDGGACVEAPRPIRPLSLSTVRTARPLLRWSLPSSLTDARVELCNDAACASVISTIDVTGDETTPSFDLPNGPVFWRVSAGGRSGPLWRFDVAGRAARDTAWGIRPDYDRDGYDDVAIGAPFAGAEDGRVAVHLGASGGTRAGADAILRGGEGSGEQFGNAVACAGDLDGDGFADLAVGRPGSERVTVFFGGEDGIPEAGARMIDLDGPADGGSRFGGGVAGAGDVDGDGFGDLLVAAPGEAATPGRLYVFRGTLGGVELAPARTIVGAGRFASAIAGAGDVDGDGFADAIVGAYAAAMMRGEVHVFFGAADGLSATAAITIAGTSADGQLGFSVAGAGDVNGDGLADVVAGAPNANGAIGQILVGHGPDAAVPIVLAGINGTGGFFGHSVAGLGDGDGDGFGDLAVGAIGVDSRAGRVTIVLGSAIGLGARTDINGPFGAGGDFGWSVASAGDVDRNGRHDLIVGAPGVDDRAGRAYVYRGGAGGVGTTPLVSILGASGGSFGRAVAGAAP